MMSDIKFAPFKQYNKNIDHVKYKAECLLKKRVKLHVVIVHGIEILKEDGPDFRHIISH